VSCLILCTLSGRLYQGLKAFETDGLVKSPSLRRPGESRVPEPTEKAGFLLSQE